ncbi:MAG: efflux RND transporter periplasmic adaptor subunit [Vulcanococcus sp.]
MPRCKVHAAHGLALILAAGLLQGCQGSEGPSVEVSRALRAEARPPSVKRGFSAPGTIEPLEGILRLAAPLTPSGLAPRVAELYVKEGERVKEGQILARFDNHPSVLQELAAEDTTIRSLQSEKVILERQTRRFMTLLDKGVIPRADFEDRELRLSQLRNQLAQSRARRNVIREQLLLSQLVAPISGMVLSIQSRSGEQPGIEGVLDLADPLSIGAIAQVEEKHIPGLQPGQSVLVSSENGYFTTPLQARIRSIAHRVTPRRSLLTKPGLYKDSEPRVVDVQLEFTQTPPVTLAKMSGAKVMVQFQPR